MPFHALHNFSSYAMSKKPTLNGLKPDFSFNEMQCKVIKMDQSLMNVPVKDWTNVQVLVSSFLGHHGIAFTSATEALSLIKSSFNTISIKRRNHLSLVSYCKRLVDYFALENVKRDFSSQYTDKFNQLEGEKLEKQVEQAGYNNGVLATAVGLSKYKKKLVEQLCDKDGVLANKPESSKMAKSREATNLIPKKATHFPIRKKKPSS
jgi:hypothetical protein